MDETEKTALVTGAARGIGLAIKQRFEKDGIRVIDTDIHNMNLLSDTAIVSFIEAIQEPVDILINNAGINLLSSCIEVTDDNIEKTLQVNLLAPLKLTRLLAPGMIKRKYGRIVNISSIWGAVTKERRVTYTMSKSGINGLTKTLAVELAPHNILVNAVAPGYVNTELTRQNTSESEIEAIRQTIPVLRLAEPEYIAEVVAFLASENNRYITGQVIIADGGYTCL